MKLIQSLFFLLFIERLAMPAIYIFQEWDTFACYRFRYNHSRRTIWLRGFGKCLVNFIIVMTINDDGIPTKSHGSLSVEGCIPAMHCFSTLSKAVNIKDSYQVI